MYIGPGAGFAVLGSFLTFFASLVLATSSLISWPFRMMWMVVRGRRGYRRAKAQKVIFLGLDGFDPKRAERLMAEGKLPNLAKLAASGSYRRLRTTFPALSPVAWSTFATGVNPAKHNIFDFLNRDLQSYAPRLSSAEVHPPRRHIRFGRWSIPISKPVVDLYRKSKPFWTILGEHAITSTILRVPITFPAEEFNGRLLSAMCTPDLRGTQGSFSWFSTREFQGDLEGGSRYLLRKEGRTLRGELEGPGGIAIPFRIADESIEIDGSCYPLKNRQYTPWIRVSFQSAPGVSADGIVRFLLMGSGEETTLYATPIQIDPENPALPISHPRYYAIYLSKLLGPFATVGMAEDTWALNERVIDEGGFLDQVESIKQEREKMFFSALDRTRRGVVACVFDTPDRVQHMFYRYVDGREVGPHADVIERMYKDMDRIVGETMKYVDDRTAFFVLSDHGFCSFRRGVDLNAWLRQNGYLTLHDGAAESGKYFEGVDWSRTRAYALGLGGLYLNVKGREASGIVAAGDIETLKSEIVAKLGGLRDTDNSVAIQHVYMSSSLYSGPYLDSAPDLIVGYSDGYRASWDAAIGRVREDVFEDNDKAWSGDHCVDPQLVPGVLFTNGRIDAADPGIEDMAPTALSLFGIEKPAWMEGNSLLNSV
ncbi:MAG TPA: alkaline phosphatase family protein [Bryobacteraceae bacterium]|nr:alkaline phosphatase family protein [Bryobacteraceae bacterium]